MFVAFKSTKIRQALRFALVCILGLYSIDGQAQINIQYNQNVFVIYPQGLVDLNLGYDPCLLTQL